MCAGGEPDWEGTRASHDMLFLGFSVHHPAHGSVYVGFNPHHYAFDVAVPEAPAGSAWARIADTALPAPNDFSVQPGAPAEPIQARKPGPSWGVVHPPGTRLCRSAASGSHMAVVADHERWLGVAGRWILQHGGQVCARALCQGTPAPATAGEGRKGGAGRRCWCPPTACACLIDGEQGIAWQVLKFWPDQHEHS